MKSKNMISKLNIKSILIMAIIGIFSLMFLGKSFAAVTGKVNVETANVRETTDANSTILEQASKGESVEVVEKNGEWYKVKYNGVQGYVREDLLEVSGNVAETGATKNTAPAQTTTDSKTDVATKTQENTTVTEKTTEQPVATTTTADANKKENILEGMYIAKSDVNLKLIPLVNGNNIKEIKKDTTISILGVYNNWALAESGLDRGWLLFNKIEKVDENAIAAQQPAKENKEEEKKEEETKPEEKEEKTTEVSVSETTMYINWDLVNLREEPSKSSNAITSLTKATEVTVFARDGEWSKVRVNGNEGYIKTSLLSDTKPEVTTSRSLEQERQPIETEDAPAEEAPAASQPVSSAAGDVCSYAKQYLGCNYVYGGTSPAGFDCSGFTQYVYSNFGVDLNRTAEAQASNGTYVPKSELQAGDLLIFTHHAGIYLGDGTFIHAANSRSGVIITDLDESYYVNNYITARRVL